MQDQLTDKLGAKKGQQQQEHASGEAGRMLPPRMAHAEFDGGCLDHAAEGIARLQQEAIVPGRQSVEVAFAVSGPAAVGCR